MNSKAYWILLGEKMIHGAAAGALATKISTESTDIYTVGWQTMLVGAAAGALYTLLTGLGSDAIPGTLNQSFVAASPRIRRAAASVHRPRKVRRSPATTTPASDLDTGKHSQPPGTA